MCAAASIPPELLACVFSLLDSEEVVRTCRLVCVAWCRAIAASLRSLHFGKMEFQRVFGDTIDTGQGVKRLMLSLLSPTKLLASKIAAAIVGDGFAGALGKTPSALAHGFIVSASYLLGGPSIDRDEALRYSGVRLDRFCSLRSFLVAHRGLCRIHMPRAINAFQALAVLACCAPSDAAIVFAGDSILSADYSIEITKRQAEKVVDTYERIMRELRRDHIDWFYKYLNKTLPTGDIDISADRECARRSRVLLREAWMKCLESSRGISLISGDIARGLDAYWEFRAAQINRVHYLHDNAEHLHLLCKNFYALPLQESWNLIEVYDMELSRWLERLHPQLFHLQDWTLFIEARRAAHELRRDMAKLLRMRDMPAEVWSMMYGAPNGDATVGDLKKAMLLDGDDGAGVGGRRSTTSQRLWRQRFGLTDCQIFFEYFT